VQFSFISLEDARSEIEEFKKTPVSSASSPVQIVRQGTKQLPSLYPAVQQRSGKTNERSLQLKCCEATVALPLCRLPGFTHQ